MTQEYSMIVTRFAPSPTGFLHLGSLRTALFNFVFTRKTGGRFLLRIEDTDEARNKDDSIQSILDGLAWLGIHPDEAHTFQSHNFDRHRQVAEELVAKKKAFYCYCGAQEKASHTQNATLGTQEQKSRPHDSSSTVQDPKLETQNSTPDRENRKYSGHCRGTYVRHENSPPPVIRIDSSSFESVEFEDCILGVSKFGRDNLDDFIILRSSGLPTYMFSVVIDDYDSGVNFIIRGNDHHTNTANQLLIYKQMGWIEPQYAHLPLIHTADGKKMSKRRDAVDVIKYKNQGFYPEVFSLYLMSLGWNLPENTHSFDQIIPIFKLQDVGKSPARFDIQKLEKMNGQYMKNLDRTELINQVIQFAKLRKLQYKDFGVRAITHDVDKILERSNTLAEFLQQTLFYTKAFRITATIDVQLKKQLHEKFLTIDDLEWREDKLKDAINTLIKTSAGGDSKKIWQTLRLAITNTENSYPIMAIMISCGKARILERLECGL